MELKRTDVENLMQVHLFPHRVFFYTPLCLKGLSDQTLAFILWTIKLNMYFLEDLLWILSIYFKIPELFQISF